MATQREEYGNLDKRGTWALERDPAISKYPVSCAVLGHSHLPKELC